MNTRFMRWQGITMAQFTVAIALLLLLVPKLMSIA
jgi:hypothetical protein